MIKGHYSAPIQTLIMKPGLIISEDNSDQILLEFG